MESKDLLNDLKTIRDFKYIPSNKDSKFTSIIIVTFNGLEYTKLCIESIRKFTEKESYEIIVIDNNSTDGTKEWISNESDLKVIINKENLGFTTACNQGIRIARGDILLLNNDVIVTPRWLDNLNKALYSAPNIGAVGPVSNYVSNNQQIDVSYSNVYEMLKFADDYNISNNKLWEYKIKLIGYCYLIKKEVIDKVGVLDERFTPGHYEDDDISIRILYSGYNLLMCKDTFIHHFGSASFKKKDDLGVLISTNYYKFIEKWGFEIAFGAPVKWDLINKINVRNDERINILELGCGLGGTLLELKNRYKNANLYGIEENSILGRVSEGVFNVIIDDIRTAELPYQKRFFDYILLGDKINDKEIKDKFTMYLKVGGEII